MTVLTDPTIPVASWLSSVLRNDSQLQALAPGDLWEDVLPEGVSAFPAMVFQQVTSVDVRAMNDFSHADMSYRVKVIDNRGNYGRTGPAALRILALLDGNSGAVAEGEVFECQRAQTPAIIRYLEVVEGGGRFAHHGYEFRILAR